VLAGSFEKKKVTKILFCKHGLKPFSSQEVPILKQNYNVIDVDLRGNKPLFKPLKGMVSILISFYMGSHPVGFNHF